MPSSISNFSDAERTMKVKIEVDLGLGTGMVDFTDNLENFSIFQREATGRIYGIFDYQLDAQLFVPNADVVWARAGLPVRATVSISGDKGLTWYDHQLFYGTTELANTIPQTTVRIKATSLNSNYLNKKVARQVFVNQDIHDIIRSILLEAGVPTYNINLSASGLRLPVYKISDDVQIEKYIEDLSKPLLNFYGFDANGIFVVRSLSQITFSGSAVTPAVTFSKNEIYDYKQQSIKSSTYFNSATIVGKQQVYLPDKSVIYSNTSLSGYEIKPLQRLYVNLSLSDVDPIYVYPLINATFAGAGNNNSAFILSTIDDGSGADIVNSSVVTVVSQALASASGGKDQLFLVLENTSSSTSYFLKKMKLLGSGVSSVGNILVKYKNAPVITADGKEYEASISSNAIQTDAVGRSVLALLQLNWMQYLDVFGLEVAGHPLAEIGAISQVQAMNATVYSTIILQTDGELSLEKGYEMNIMAKKIAANLSFLICDDPSLTPTKTDVDYCFF